MSTFVEFRDAVNAQIAKMVKSNELFRVDVDKDLLWETYLSSFPEGTNPIYKTNTEHDCNCCRQYIKTIGGMVSIKNGKLSSIWDIDLDGHYKVVADAMSKLVKKQTIAGIFRADSNKIGVEKNHELTDEGKSIPHSHFSSSIPKKFVNKDSGPVVGAANDNFNVLKRSLEEISCDAINIVEELIDQNSLYRGEEHKATVAALKAAKKGYDKISSAKGKVIYLWDKSVELNHGSRFRNTVIGTLLTDISEGKELDKAVKSFEDKVAPHNYKRTTALITKGMIDAAGKKVEELGIADALHRRYAVADDLTINNVLFADRTSKKKMQGVFDDLAPTAPKKAPSMDKVQEISISDFIENVLPKADTLEVFVENRHTNNLVSLIAPIHPDAQGIFKWGNSFSWSYNGDIADSDIRKKVIAKGGRVDGVFRFSHSWNHRQRNASLMDLHVFMPGSTSDKGQYHDKYGNRERVGWNNRKHAQSGGIQDVDYTDAAPEGYVPVENITFPDISRMREGEYFCRIHNWQLRSPTQGGFQAEIEFDGQVFEYCYDKKMGNKEWVDVATVTLKDGKFTIEHHLPPTSGSQSLWGVETQQFRKVSMVMNSPNHWDGEETGNKHWFFMLDSCYNPDKARGFYNEFLRGDLTEHRKVFEVLSSKMKTEESDNQLSGLGFSSTKRDSLLIKVGGSFNRIVKVVF